MYKDQLILYEGTVELKSKAVSYINNLTGSMKKPTDIVILLNRSDECINQNIRKVPMLKTFFSDQDNHSNITLSILRSLYARKLGGKYYSAAEGHAIILFDLDTLQMDYIYNLKKNSELVFHLFMKKSKFNDGNLLTNLNDYISIMNIEINQ